MLDGLMRGLIDAPLNRGGRWLAGRGASANAVTLIGLVLGLAAAATIAVGQTGLVAVLLVLASRLADGLDGAVARARGKTDFGGYLDIACDFAFYAAIPAAFVIANPAQNGAAGAALLASFFVNGGNVSGLCHPCGKTRDGDEKSGREIAVFHSGAVGRDRDDSVFCDRRALAIHLCNGGLDICRAVSGDRFQPGGAGATGVRRLRVKACTSRRSPRLASVWGLPGISVRLPLQPPQRATKTLATLPRYSIPDRQAGIPCAIRLTTT